MIKIGISTASLFLRELNEDAVATINRLGAECAEVFLATYCEYKTEFAKLIAERKGNLAVHSVHTLNTHFEPQLYSEHVRAKADAYAVMRDALESAKIFGAKNYTFHGLTRLKKSYCPDYDAIGRKTNDIIEKCGEYGINLCFENVHWAFCNEPGVFTELKKRCPKLRAVLDIKQAAQSGHPYEEYFEEMSDRLNTVHVLDCDRSGNLCLPGRGTFDFETLTARLRDVGFDGAVLIEAYKSDYGTLEDLSESCEYLKSVRDKIAK